MKILNFGSLNLDYVYRVEHIVSPGETIASTDFQQYCGGKGLNQSIALAKAGASVWHAGLIGENGGILKETLERYGVCTEWLGKCAGANGHAMIQVDQNGQNSIVLYGGSNQKLTAEYIDDVLSHFGEGDILLLQNEVNGVVQMIERAHRRGMRIALNPSPFSQEIETWPLELVDWLILNEIEGLALGGLSGDASAEEILAALCARFPQCAVVLTLGKAGGLYQNGVYRASWASRTVEAVDTTAAGDTFTGYFLAEMANGADVAAALSFSAAASALAVSRKGAADSIPCREEAEMFWKQERAE